MRKHKHEDGTKGMLYSLYIRQGKKWKKTGEVCTCGQFFMNPQLLEKTGINGKNASFSFVELSPQ